MTKSILLPGERTYPFNINRVFPPIEYGPPTRGLQGIWFLGRNNLLLDPAAFSSVNWTKTRSYIAANCAADPSTGAYTVDKLVEDGTASNSHIMSQSYQATGGAMTLDVVIAAAGRGWVAIELAASYLTYINLSTGAWGEQLGLDSRYTEVVGAYRRVRIIGSPVAGARTATVYLANGDGGYSYSGLGHQGTAAAGGSTTTAVLASGASASDDTYNTTEIIFSDAPTTIHTVTDYVGATKTATFTPARASAPDATTYTVGPGILIARAQLNAGTTAYSFEDRGTQQTLPIYRGTAGTLQRGATTGAEASDPGLRNDGLSFVTDDYVLGQNLSNVTMAGDWTVYIVGLFNGTTDGLVVLGIADGTVADNYVYAHTKTSAGNLTISSRSSAGTTTGVSAIAVSTTNPTVVCCSSSSGTLSARNLSTGTAEVTSVSRNPVGTPRMGVGVIPCSVPLAAIDAMTGYAVALANVAHTAAERARMYAWLKSELAKPPYNLSVL